MSAVQLMQKVAIETGAKFTLESGEVGLTKPIPERLLKQAINHKDEIKKVLLKFNSTNTASKLTPKHSKVWNIKIKTGDEINSMSMIDPDSMSHEECKKVLIEKFGADRIVEFKERS